MSFLVGVGRVLFSAIFILSNVMKLQDIDGITNMVYSKMNTDYPQLEITREYAFGMVVFVAVLGLLGGILIAIGKASYGGAFVALFLALITPIMHNPAKSDNPEIEQIMIMKNLALFGGALAIWGYHNKSNKIAKVKTN